MAQWNVNDATLSVNSPQEPVANLQDSCDNELDSGKSGDDSCAFSGDQLLLFWSDVLREPQEMGSEFFGSSNGGQWWHMFSSTIRESSIWSRAI